MYSSPNSFLSSPPHRYRLKPACGYINGGKRGQVEAICPVSAMGHQIHLDKSRPAVFPFTKSLQGYGILKMGTGFSQTETMLSVILPPAPRDTIDR